LAYEFRAVRPSLSAFAGEGARATKYPSAIILGDEVDELSTEGKHKVPFGRLRAGFRLALLSPAKRDQLALAQDDIQKVVSRELTASRAQ